MNLLRGAQLGKGGGPPH